MTSLKINDIIFSLLPKPLKQNSHPSSQPARSRPTGPLPSSPVTLHDPTLCDFLSHTGLCSVLRSLASFPTTGNALLTPPQPFHTADFSYSSVSAQISPPQRGFPWPTYQTRSPMSPSVHYSNPRLLVEALNIVIQ